jgi:ubiquinone/menaquinone biosynthesis C-methylase UbiE
VVDTNRDADLVELYDLYKKPAYNDPADYGDPYRDADLVELYDLDNPDGEAQAYYRALADDVNARSIIDLGCGTGLLTRSFARAGRTVIGVDPSATMLNYARRQAGSENVTWIHGDASVLPQDGTADLAVCTGDAILHISPDELPPTLASLAGVLRHGATLSFASRNPADRAWERWTPRATYMERVTPLGFLREWHEVTDVCNGRVVYDRHTVFPNCEDHVYTSVVFFRTSEEFQRELDRAGFTDITWAGSPGGIPFDDTAKRFDFRARRA